MALPRRRSALPAGCATASKSCSTLASLSCSPSRGSSRAKLCASRTLTRPTSSEETASCSTWLGLGLGVGLG